MRIETIDELADVLTNSSLAVLDLEGQDFSLTLERAEARRNNPATETAQLSVVDAVEKPIADSVRITYIEANVVGVFHEGNPPVIAGHIVDEGALLGTIEALALRNDVRATESGEVAAVQVEDGQPVEYGQVLFALRLSGGSL